MAEALQGSERFMSKLGAVHGCSGGALVGALLLCPGALVKVKEYVASGRALRGMGLKELWDPALLIPRAVEARRSAHMAQAVQESGALTEDTHRILSGRLHVHCTRGGFFRGEPVPSPGGLETWHGVASGHLLVLRVQQRAAAGAASLFFLCL